MTDSIIEHIRCAACKQDKPSSQFHKNKARKNGFAGECRRCKALYRKAYHVRNVDKEREYCREQRRIRKSKGLCVMCGKEPAGNRRTHCHNCRAYKGERAEKLWQSGFCSRCGVRPAAENRKQCERCLAMMVRINQRHYQDLRERVLDKYGRVCKCCGEADSRFLTIDHVNSDGKAHRAGKKSHISYYNHMLSDDCAFELQVLCWNCNMGRAHYGECPHKWEQ